MKKLVLVLGILFCYQGMAKAGICSFTPYTYEGTNVQGDGFFTYIPDRGELAGVPQAFGAVSFYLRYGTHAAMEWSGNLPGPGNVQNSGPIFYRPLPENCYPFIMGTSVQTKKMGTTGNGGTYGTSTPPMPPTPPPLD